MENTLKATKAKQREKYKSTDNITPHRNRTANWESPRSSTTILNEEGFNTLRIVCSDNLDAEKKFLKRFLALNGIRHFLLVKTKKKIEIDTFIHEKVRNYKHILKYTRIYGARQLRLVLWTRILFFGKQNRMSSAKN